MKPLWFRVNLPCDALILPNRIGLSTPKTSEKKNFLWYSFCRGDVSSMIPRVYAQGGRPPNKKGGSSSGLERDIAATTTDIIVFGYYLTIS